MNDRLPEQPLLCPACGTPTNLKGPSPGPGGLMASYKCPRCPFRAWIPTREPGAFLTDLALSEGPETEN